MTTNQYSRMVNPDIENNHIIKKQRPSREVISLMIYMIAVVMVVFTIIAAIDTAARWKDEADRILIQQADMLARCDAMESQLIQVSEAVEAMPVVIHDETIQRLADPAGWKTTEPLSATAMTKAEPVWMTFEVTAYCPCIKCCGKSDGITATGTKAAEGQTVGADWSVLPTGTVIEIEGIGIRTVEDRGSAIKGNRLDLFFDRHRDALEFGRQKLRVRVIG